MVLLAPRCHATGRAGTTEAPRSSRRGPDRHRRAVCASAGAVEEQAPSRRAARRPHEDRSASRRTRGGADLVPSHHNRDLLRWVSDSGRGVPLGAGRRDRQSQSVAGVRTRPRPGLRRDGRVLLRYRQALARDGRSGEPQASRQCVHLIAIPHRARRATQLSSSIDPRNSYATRIGAVPHASASCVATSASRTCAGCL